MKNLLFTLAFVCSLTLVMAETPPKEVLEAFQFRYTNATDVKWESEGTIWEADFVYNGKEMSASYLENGKWQETETTLSMKMIPLRINEFITTNYPKYKVIEIEEVDHSIKGRFFEIELKKCCKRKEIQVDANGEIVKG